MYDHHRVQAVRLTPSLLLLESRFGVYYFSQPKPHLKDTWPRQGALSPLYAPLDGVTMGQRVAKRKRLTRGTASVVEEDSPESDDGPPDPAVKR